MATLCSIGHQLKGGSDHVNATANAGAVLAPPVHVRQKAFVDVR